MFAERYVGTFKGWMWGPAKTGYPKVADRLMGQRGAQVTTVEGIKKDQLENPKANVSYSIAILIIHCIFFVTVYMYAWTGQDLAGDMFSD